MKAMKLGALLSKIRTPEFRHWLRAEDMVRMATEFWKPLHELGKEYRNLGGRQKSRHVPQDFFHSAKNRLYMNQF